MANSSSVRPYFPKKQIHEGFFDPNYIKVLEKSRTSIARMVGRSLTWKPEDDGIFLKWKKKWCDLLNDTFWKDQRFNICEKKANTASPFFTGLRNKFMKLEHAHRWEKLISDLTLVVTGYSKLVVRNAWNSAPSWSIAKKNHEHENGCGTGGWNKRITGDGK